jgi:methylamine dehydrogenase accessory protein MauD
MDTALLAVRVVLAAVFLVAGLAKLADRPGARQALIDFGLPVPLATPLGIFLPVAELVVAAALIPPATAWWGGLGALALLLLFLVGIGLSLARGRRPDCHCFGQLHSEPIGWRTLARNGVLAMVATFVVWRGAEQPGLDALGLSPDLAVLPALGLSIGLLVLAALVIEGWLVLNLLRQQGRLLLRLEAIEARLGLAAHSAPPVGLPIGAPAPAFSLADLDGKPVTLDGLRTAGKPLLLLFSDPNCGPCTALLPELGRWQREHHDKLVLVPIGRGPAEENRPLAEHGVTGALLQRDREVAEAYQASGTPSAVLVRPDGTIGSPVAPGADAIRTLVGQVVRGEPVLLPMVVPAANGANGHAHPPPAMPATPGIGEPAPPIRLPDLAGRTVDLADFRGSPTLVVFWNPGCGFCRQLLPELKVWEVNPPPEAPHLLVVSAGTVEANQAQGFRAPVVLDDGFLVGRSFGTSGTPSAVLVDGEGKIASVLAVGGPAVLALARASERQSTSA